MRNGDHVEVHYITEGKRKCERTHVSYRYSLEDTDQFIADLTVARNAKTVAGL